jgi:hypothetical protein
MPRAVLAAILSVLLLFMQAEGYRHALTHDASRYTRHEHGLQLPHDEICAECALLASGVAAPAASASTVPDEGPPSLAVAPAVSGYTAAAPVHYDSRGPPLLL